MQNRRRGRRPASAPGFELCSKPQRGAGRTPRRLVLAALAAVALLIAPGARAAVVPGTPLQVAPGVPGQGRAWELVSSPEPLSAFPVKAYALRADGGRFAYANLGLLSDSPSPYALPAPVVATRAPAGWANRSIVAPLPKFSATLEPSPVAFSPGLETSIWQNEMKAFGSRGLFRRDADGAYELMVDGAEFRGASTDLHHFIAASAEHLLPADAGRSSGRSLYEVVGPTLRLVDVDDSGELLSSCGSTTGRPHPISDDGQRIFFATSPGCAGTQRVFVRVGGATTTEISASHCALADCGPEADVELAGATPTGSSAFLLTAQRLTDDDANDHADLYRYDVSGGELERVSAGSGSGELVPTGRPVLLPAAGPAVYFVAAELGPGGASGPRLYRADGTGVRLVSAGSPGGYMQASLDGRFVLFSTPAPLVGRDVDTSVDVYRYDAEAGGVTLVSAGPAGGSGPFDAGIAPEEILFETGGLDSHPYRAMSDDGRRIFFTTGERMLPEDGNEVADVYGWEDGQLALLSSGAGDEGSDYVTATPDGSTVLLQTADTLLPRDRDGGTASIYAARVGGGFPEPPPPAADGCDDACRLGSRGRLDRVAPPTAAVPARIRLRRIGPAERRRIVATGRLSLLAEVPMAGKLTARAVSGAGGRRFTVALAAVEVRRAGAVSVRMGLTPPARRSLARGRDLPVRLSLRLASLDPVHRVGFLLEGVS